ncbi:MAG: alanine racemase [Thermoleophilaceae bacterium]|nr:alanine racemase [Thermoleophilaceae bacterium]
MDAKRIRANLDRVRDQIVAAGGDLEAVELCVAIKYVEDEDLRVLAEAGVRLVGENRAQRMAQAHARYGDLFEWDFIGVLQSRRVRDVAPLARLIHSLASESAARKLVAHPAKEVLVEVNVAGEKGKAGIAPADLADFLDQVPVPVGGLMTMPPRSDVPGANRRHFAALAELAAEHGLARLSMGTSQDFEDAIREGATIVRLGRTIYE